MKFTKIALTLLCSTILFCGCAKDSDIVLKINDTNITRKEFYSDFEKIKNVQLKQAPKDMQQDDSYSVIALKSKFLNDLIVRELLEQEFDKRKIQITDNEIQAKKQQLIAQIGSEEQFNNILKQNDISEERLKSDISNEVKMEKLIKQLGNKTISESDAKKFYNQNKAQFTAPERVLASHILFSTNPDDIRRKITDADKEAKLSQADIEKKVQEELKNREKLANEIRSKAVSNPKNFASLAKQYSDDEVSAKNGGDLGYITKDSVVSEFGQAAFKQKVNTISPVVKSQFGYHIILVKDKAPEQTQSFKDVKADIITFLERQNKAEKLRELISGLKNSAKIEYLDESLKPEVMEAKIKESFQKQLQKSQTQGAPKSKQKILDKIKKDKETK